MRRRRGLLGGAACGWWRPWLGGLSLVGLLAGCQVDTRVDVSVADDGSGEVSVEVTLDEAATERVPDLADQLVVDDLVDAGWDVEGPTAAAGGRTTIRASKAFASVERAGGVLAEVTGVGGPFRDLRVRRSPTLVRDEWGLTGVVDLSDGLAGFGDPALRERLDGTDVGLSDDELADALGRPPAEAFTFEVAVVLPGSVSADPPATTEALIGGRGRAVWRPLLGGDRLELSATGSRLNVVPAASLAVAAVALGALAVVLGLRARKLVAVRRGRRPGSIRGRGGYPPPDDGHREQRRDQRSQG